MTNTLAIVMGGIVVAALILDQILNTGTATLFIMRKVFALIEYVSIWR